MPSTKYRSRIKRIIRIVLLSATGLIIFSGISTYFLLHNYINKIQLMNTNASKEDRVETKISYQVEEEVIDHQENNLVKKDIDLLSVDQESENLPVTAVTEKIVASKETLASRKTLAPKVAIMKQRNDIEEETLDAADNEISLLDKTISENLAETTTIMEDEDITNILLIGSDTRNSDKRGRSDSMIVISINQKNKKIIATSFLRDIYLQIPGRENNRLNSAYATGGADLLLETLQLNFKFKIDKYIMIDFFAFVDIVDAIGGVTIEVDENELEVVNQYIMDINDMMGEERKADCLPAAGTYLLNGKQALGYSRNRYSAKGDFDRTGHQREVLMEIYNKAKQQNLFEMNDFLKVILPRITTNFSESEILTKLFMLPNYLEYDHEDWSVPTSGTYQNLNVNGMAVLGIDFKSNIDEIYIKLYEVH